MDQAQLALAMMQALVPWAMPGSMHTEELPVSGQHVLLHHLAFHCRHCRITAQLLVSAWLAISMRNNKRNRSTLPAHL